MDKTAEMFVKEFKVPAVQGKMEQLALRCLQPLRLLKKPETW